MKPINDRIRNLRNNLHLSQEYVANYLGISRTAITQIESGSRKVSAEELSLFSKLFGVSADSLLNEEAMSQPATIFARSFESLDEADQTEIMNLIRFKEQMKAARSK